jgi:NAD(P)-dependent dehydrogenase (short-subunit alcohol dehydrogenase family)
VLPLDVTDSKQVHEAVRAAEKNFGGIDVLVNNAGRGWYGSIEGMADTAVRKMFELNYFAVNPFLGVCSNEDAMPSPVPTCPMQTLRGRLTTSIDLAGPLALTLGLNLFALRVARDDGLGGRDPWGLAAIATAGLRIQWHDRLL